MRVSPMVGLAPTNLVVRTHVEADEANRSIPLDGANAPCASVFEFRSLPAGLYAVRAVLKGQGGRELATAETQVTLIDDSPTGR